MGGRVLCLAIGILTHASCGNATGDGPSSMPSRLWEGGHRFYLRINASHPGKVIARFDRPSKGEGLVAEESLEAGNCNFTIDMPEGVRGSIQVVLPKVPYGATLQLEVYAGKRLVHTWRRENKSPSAYEDVSITIKFEDFAKGAQPPT